MMITKKGFYALTAVLQLGKMQEESLSHDAVFQISSIAQPHSMSVPYLEQIFRKLKSAKVVEAKRGPCGGYRITKPLAEVFVIDIMKAVGEKTRFTICSDCSNSNRRILFTSQEKSTCNTHVVWSEMTKIVNDYLSSTNLATLIEKNASFCQSSKCAGGLST